MKPTPLQRHQHGAALIYVPGPPKFSVHSLLRHCVRARGVEPREGIEEYRGKSVGVVGRYERKREREKLSEGH